MKPISNRRPSDEEAIEATAAAWLAQRDVGLTPSEAAEFESWRAADPRHDAAMARYERTWNALIQLRDFRPEARMHPDRDLLRPLPVRRRVVVFPAIVTSAIAAAFLFAAVWWNVGSKRGSEAEPQRFATTIDGYERVALEDGSLLDLNSNSNIVVHFTATERRVRLERGEVHFTVAKNVARPFLVEVGAVTVRAVGTAFNVRLNSAEVEVLVTEGKVAVGPEREIRADRTEQMGSPVQPDSALQNPTITDSELVVAGHRVVMSVTSSAPVLIEKVSPDVVREALAWQGPRLVFLDTPLADAIAQFNRRNRVQLVLGDAELASLPMGGSFRAENVEAFVRLLSTSPDIVVQRENEDQITLRKRPQ